MRLSALIVLLAFASSNAHAAGRESPITNFSPVLLYGYQALDVNGVDNVSVGAISAPIARLIALLCIALLAAAAVYLHRRRTATKIAGATIFDRHHRGMRFHSAAFFRERKWCEKRAAMRRGRRVRRAQLSLLARGIAGSEPFGAAARPCRRFAPRNDRRWRLIRPVLDAEASNARNVGHALLPGCKVAARSSGLIHVDPAERIG
jgi:hypothetical protein